MTNTTNTTPAPATNRPATLEVNRGDWSGRTVTAHFTHHIGRTDIQIDGYDGYTFALHLDPTDYDDEILRYSLRLDGEEIAYGYDYGYENGYATLTAKMADIEREMINDDGTYLNADLKAAVQIICNIL